jgi:hypothetical protein
MKAEEYLSNLFKEYRQFWNGTTSVSKRHFEEYSSLQIKEVIEEIEARRKMNFVGHPDWQQKEGYNRCLDIVIDILKAKLNER